MRPIKGYSEAKATSFNAVERLPAGGYVLKILDVKEENYNWGDVVVLRFDVNEGEQKAFFSKQYNAMNDEFKKWKGTYRLNIPAPKSDSEEDMKKYQRSLGFFKSQIEAINKSNNINIDCSKEWDISVLKDRIVGAVFGNKEWEYDGRTGWFTECNHLLDVADVREGNFTIPKDKPLKTDNDSAQKNNVDLSDFGPLDTNQAVPF